MKASKKLITKGIITTLLTLGMIFALAAFMPGSVLRAKADDSYTVTLIGGKNATASGGSLQQIGLTGAMTTVTYTAEEGYRFASFDDIVNNGITIKRTDDNEVTVSGTPTGDAEIVVPDAVSSLPYITFTGTEPFSIKTNNEKQSWDGTLQYSTNAADTDPKWEDWNGTEISSGEGKVLYLRGTGNTVITGGNHKDKSWVIKSEGKISCSGNIMTLLDYKNPDSTTMANLCFSYMLYDCTNLIKAPSLPATRLADYCYYNMFYRCINLSEAPSLPATRLADYCYYNMFFRCINLSEAPSLPATTLAYACYYSMFDYCTNLIKAPSLPATTLADKCYYGMFMSCTNLSEAPSLPATTLAEGCYSEMFMFCRNLSIIPELPATELKKYCYQSMFSNCSNLKLSEVENEFYNVEYRIPSRGEGKTAEQALTHMFVQTGGDFQGTPEINRTYYIHGYSVKLTGGGHATASGGETTQVIPPISPARAMTTVTYKADSDYSFAEFEDITSNGITVKWTGDTEVTVSGTPTGDVEIAVPDAKIYVAVTYKVAGGTWSDGTTTDLSEAVAVGSKPAKVPTGMKTPSDNYYGAWDKDPAGTAISEATTFTYKFMEKTAAALTKAPAGKTLTFNGSAQELVSAGETTDGTVQYALGSDDKTAPADGWSASIPTATNAGTYYVWYKVIGDGRHKDTQPKVVEVQIAPSISPASISLDKTSAVMKKGETLALTATLLPEDVTERDVVWTAADYADSTKTPVVTVAEAIAADADEGKANLTESTAADADAGKANVSEATVTANDTGKVIVTAATGDGEFTASCVILVVSDKLSQEILDKIEPDKQYSNEDDKPATPAPVIPDPVKVKEGMTIPLTYDSAAVTYNGKKADPEEQFGAKADLSALAADLTIKDTTKTINDLIKVSWAVSGKDKGNRYFYPKLTVTSDGKSSAVLSAKDRKTLKSRVKKANKALKKSGKCKFTVNKRSLTDGTLSVKVQMKNGVIKKSKKKGIAKVNYVKLKISDTETITLKNGKDCKVTLIDAETCLVKVEAKKNSSFTGSVTVYVE